LVKYYGVKTGVEVQVVGQNVNVRVVEADVGEVDSPDVVEIHKFE